MRGAGRQPIACWTIALVFVLVGCSDDDEPSHWSFPVNGGAEAGADAAHDAAEDATVQAPDADASGVDAPGDSLPEAGDAATDAPAACPLDMVLVDSTCIDRFEAPNREGALPLVMYHFDEAASWCAARGKRLCFDDEWTRVCGGAEGQAYPYGYVHEPGVCTDDKTWLTYDQSLLNGWPWNVDTDGIESLEELLDAARAEGGAAASAADHVAWLYQADPSGSRGGCTTGDGAFDLSGNVEEWTRRRSGATDGFNGNLKGRYWAETRTCQQSVTTHGDLFRFYEIGFRCCLDRP